MIPIATISRGVRNEGGLPFAKICQEALAYSLILNEMQRIGFSAIALVRVCRYVCVCVSMCVCVCVCLFYHLNASLVDRTKTVLDKSAIVSPSCRPLKRHPITFGDVVAYDIYLLLKVIDSIPNHLDRLDLIIS